MMEYHLKCNSSDHQDRCIELIKNNCTNQNLKNYNGTKCSSVFDEILCWPETLPNTIVVQPCPKFFLGFDLIHNNVTKQCMEDGQWYRKNGTNDLWTNYSQCYSSSLVIITESVPTINASLIAEYLPIIKYIARTGYFISFSTLLVAFCIMFSIKKLHCARNKLHMHLFASFIFRAAMFFLKDFLFVKGVGLFSDLHMVDGNTYFIEELGTNNWQCKMITSFWQYFITANYSWILMEGLYLHNLILLALFSDSNNSIRCYIILGWGLPAVVVGSYVIARLFLDNNLCWTTYGNSYIFLIIKIPTMLSNLINFILFLNIARVLLLKLRSPISEETKLFRRWARSTLVLVPLFGVHYALFMGMSYSMGINETIELIWLFCDQLFASFQGFFVAVLYCFLNGEVKTELRPHFNNFVTVWIAAPFSFLHCGEFSRSTTGRPSVCTTLSCSSLYTSSVNHKYPSRKSKWDVPQVNGTKLRHSSIPENYHVCHQNEKVCPDHPNHILQYDSTGNLKCPDHCYSTKGNTQLTEISEITACLGSCDHNTKTEDLEMITLASQ